MNQGQPPGTAAQMRRRVRVLAVGRDLGATAKAPAADRAAARIAAPTGCGVLARLGGDISVAGEVPRGGWSIAVGDDDRTGAISPDDTVAIAGGGLATSSITTRRWRTASGPRHHLVDPRTGENPEPLWRTASAAAGNALEANAVSTASIILGRSAPSWLTARGLPYRLVGIDGTVRTLAGWPEAERSAA